MIPTDLLAQLALGEDSRRQFKQDVTNADALAAETAAFANSESGTIFLGVADDGSTSGLSRADVARINQLISNAASQNVRSPLTVRTENVGVADGRVVIVLTVPNGQDKPYFDRNGVIWLTSGSDKRMRLGVSNIRNPILVSYVAKGLLTYKGLGTGVRRALDEWPEIEFTDDRDASQFIVIIRRPGLEGSVESSQKGSQKGSQKAAGGSQKTVQKVVALLQQDATITIAGLAHALDISDRAIKKHLQALQADGRIRRVGPDRGGHWEVLE